MNRYEELAERERRRIDPREREWAWRCFDFRVWRDPLGGVRAKHEQKVWERDLLLSARANHVWLNGFACIEPTDEFCARLGRKIIAMLAEEGNTIPSEFQVTGHERELVLRINKS